MLTARKRRLGMNDPSLGMTAPNQQQSTMTDAPLDAGPDAAPQSQAIPAPVQRPLRPQGATDQPPQNGTVGGINQIADGAGGSVMVPPIALAPPSVIPANLAPVAAPAAAPRPSGQLADIGARPVATQADWGTADARGAAWDQSAEDRSFAAGAEDAANGYNIWETQDELNARRGLVQNQYTGAWEPPSGSAPAAPWETPTTGPGGTQVPAGGGAAIQPATLPWEQVGPGGVPGGGSQGTTAPTTLPAPGMPAVAPPAGGIPGVGADVPTFDAENNLIDTQVLPVADPRLLKFQGVQDQTLDKITNGPDRLALAKRYMDDSQSDYYRDITDATNAAAEHGYLGSGQLTNRYGDASERRAQQRDKYLADATAGTIQDNLNNLGAARGLAGDAYTEGANNRDEVRGERGYQRSVAETAIQRRIQQAAEEQGQSQQEFENNLELWRQGNMNDPTGAYEHAAALAAAEAAGNTALVTDLIKQWAARNKPATAGA